MSPAKKTKTTTLEPLTALRIHMLSYLKNYDMGCIYIFVYLCIFWFFFVVVSFFVPKFIELLGPNELAKWTASVGTIASPC